MQTDSFFSIGKSHSVCEDYAFHGDNCIIVSDGCSSSKHTDIGSRLLCITAHRILKSFKNEPLSYFEFGNKVVTCVSEQLRLLDLPINVIDATLLVSFVVNDKVYTYIYGDGYYQIKYTTGKIQFGTLNYNGNAPYYLSYWLDSQRHSNYLKKFGKTVEAITGIQIGNETELKSTDIEITVTNNILPIPVDEIEYVLLMSDGVESFQHYDESPPIPIVNTDILNELSSFKNIKGQFVTRRTKAALKKFKKNGIDHYDDLSIAGMYMDRS